MPLAPGLVWAGPGLKPTHLRLFTDLRISQGGQREGGGETRILLYLILFPNPEILPATRCNIGLNASRSPLDSLADVDMVNVAWVCFVPRPSAMSTSSRRERGSRARTTVTNQDLIVAPLKQTVAHAGEKSRATFDICSSAKACAASFMCEDVQSCSI